MKIDRFIIPANIEKTKFDLVREIEIKESKFKLIRENDGLTKHASRIKWMEWNEDGTLKAHHDTPAIGLSLLMSPFDESYTWLTTPITEIVEEQEGYIKFNTQNSVYELWSNVEEK